jgi:membrane peptidoglycan carboxypeptidase
MTSPLRMVAHLATTILRQRRNRRDLARRSAEGRTRRVGFGCGFAVSALAAVLALTLALVYADLVRGLPSIATLPLLLDPQNGLLLQPTRLYDRTGQHLLATLAPDDAPRAYVPLDPQAPQHLPQSLTDATIALADLNFWDHPGYVLDGWRDPESHPTLAQKLVADLLLWDEPPSTRRAVRERILAAQITARYGREQVLEWYLNSANYGHYAYGADAAARLYFGKPAADLDLSEAALLAAVSQAPALNPLDAPQAAEGRRLETLQAMQEMGMILSPPNPPPLPPISTGNGGAGGGNNPSPYGSPTGVLREGVGGEGAFTNLVLSQLGESFSRQRIERGGLAIITTLDYDVQLQVSCTVQAQLSRLAGESVDILAADGSPCEAARLLPALPPGLPAQAGLSLPDASASALVFDPRTGQVLAVVGEMRNGGESPYLASHPAGTLLTPFIYLTGFTRGLNPASLAWDIPGSLSNPDGAYHGPLRLRIALANDYLPPAAQVLAQMGEENVRRISQSFGLTLPADARLLEDEVSLPMLDLAGAYGILANQGTSVGQPLSGEALRPVAVLKVLGVDHSLWADWSAPETQAVVSPQLAYLMNHILSDETARWPSLGHPNPLEIGRPAGAKLGRSFDGQSPAYFAGQSAWVAGYTPQRVVVVWMGSAEGETTLPRLSADLWHALIQYAVRDLPVESWSAPQGIVSMDVCDPSGLLPTSACPNVVSEVFMSGDEPTQADTLYQTFQVNRETGYLATVFTPPELVEARVYLVVPPEARDWARAAGLPAPPISYDTIQMPPVLPDVHITAPAMFADVRGTLEITGTASGAGFAYFRLEYGQGLNPQTWVQIGSDVTAPVEEGTLVTWDTSGLNGLYALRLLVVRGDMRVERAVILVSVVNP